MDRKRNISVMQLFAMLFISRTVVNVTYSTYFAKNHRLWDWLIPTVVTCVLTLISLLPVYYLHKDDPKQGIIDRGYSLLGKAGIIIALIYAVYFLIVLCYTMSLFDLFVEEAMSPKISVIALSIGLLAASCYGAFKGIEAIARTSGIVFIGILLAGIILVCVLIPDIDPLNYVPVSFDDTQSLISGVVNMLSRNSCIAAMAVLLPFVKGNIRKGMVSWGLSIYAAIALLIFFLTGVLGDFLTTQSFPVYAATSLARIGVFERLDVIYLAVWTAGMFIKLSLFIFMIAAITEKVIGKTASKISMPITAVIVLLVSYVTTYSKDFMNFIFSDWLLFAATALTAVLFPLLFLIISKVKKKANKKDGKARGRENNRESYRKGETAK